MTPPDGVARHHDLPDGEIRVSPDGARLSAEWCARERVIRTAKFRIATGDGVAKLEHIREVSANGLTGGRISVDENGGLDQVPDQVLGSIQDLGFTPVDGGER